MIKFLVAVVITLAIFFVFGWVEIPTTFATGALLFGKACLIGLGVYVALGFVLFIVAAVFALIASKN